MLREEQGTAVGVSSVKSFVLGDHEYLLPILWIYGGAMAIRAGFTVVEQVLHAAELDLLFRDQHATLCYLSAKPGDRPG